MSNRITSCEYIGPWRSLKVGSMPSYRGEIMSWADGPIEYNGKIKARHLGVANRCRGLGDQ